MSAKIKLFPEPALFLKSAFPVERERRSIAGQYPQAEFAYPVLSGMLLDRLDQLSADAKPLELRMDSDVHLAHMAVALHPAGTAETDIPA